MSCFTAWLVALLILIGSVSSREERSENGTEKRLPRFGFSLLEPLRKSFCRNWCVSPSKMPYIMNLACAAKCPELYLPDQQGATSTSTSPSSTSPPAMSTTMSTQRTPASNQGSQAITLGTVTPRTGSPPSASSAQTPTSASGGQTTPGAAGGQTTPGASGGQATSSTSRGQTTPGAAGGQTTPSTSGGQTTTGAAGGQTTTGASGVQTTTGASGTGTTIMPMMQG